MICPSCQVECIDASAGNDAEAVFICPNCGEAYSSTDAPIIDDPQVVIEALTEHVNAQSQRILQLEDAVMLAYDFLQLAGNLDPVKERAVNRARLELDKAITPEMKQRQYVHIQKLTGDISDD